MGPCAGGEVGICFFFPNQDTHFLSYFTPHSVPISQIPPYVAHTLLQRVPNGERKLSKVHTQSASHIAYVVISLHGFTHLGPFYAFFFLCFSRQLPHHAGPAFSRAESASFDVVRSL